MQITIGEMLYRFRQEKGIGAKALSYGLCSPAEMSYYENGERMPDILQFEYFIERLGISPAHFSIMITKQENAYLEWRSKILDLINSCQWEKLEAALEQEKPQKHVCNKKIELQFRYFAQGVLAASKENYEKAMECLEVAAKQTIPSVEGKKLQKMQLSTFELHILILYIYYGLKNGTTALELGRHLFERMSTYILSDKMDEGGKAKCYAKLVCGACQIPGLLTEEERENYLYALIKLLQKDMSFYDITEVLRLYIEILQSKDHENTNYYKKHYEVFSDLLKAEGVSTDFHIESVIISQPNSYILQEVLLSERLEKGITQEELSEGICEPESYSRIESGNRAPSRKNATLLSERLGIRWIFYKGEIDTLSSEVYEIRTAQRTAMINGSKNALELLEALEKKLDMSSAVNRQYVQTCRCVIKVRNGSLDMQEACDELQYLLNEANEVREVAYFSQTDLETMGYLCQYYRKLNQTEKGIAIISSALKCLGQSELDYENQWNGYSFILSVLGNLYFQKKNYEKSKQIYEYIKNIEIKKRNASNLAVSLDAIADDLEHISEGYSEAYKKLYRYTYYIADFYDFQKIKIFAKKYYEEKFTPTFEWYK